jgi:serine/threonine protein kinase
MAASEQEPKTPVHEVHSTAGSPTEDFIGKQGDAFSTAADLPLPSSQETFEPLPPGRMLGQYRILERLGAGGMGQVYKAEHSVMARVVALKIISPRLMQEPSARARFQREVRNAARLIHPNIVVAHDAAEVEGMCFLVMEYVDGQDVAQLLSRYGRPPLGLACEIIRQAALGLQYAHEHGMVHRDIKPANLMVANARAQRDRQDIAFAGGSMKQGWPEAPLVKILDFGLARLSATEGVSSGRGETLTREGYIVGTPEFMSPEQARDSRTVDIRSDIYSLGCTLYMLLAGRPPFKAASSFELAVMHLNQPPEPVARYNPALPLELSVVVHRMLAKRPEDRFQTPGAVAKALQPWAHLSVAATETGFPPGLPQSSSEMASASLLAPPDSGLASSVVPSAPAAPSAPPALSPPFSERPEAPLSVRMMYLQALLRTLFLTVLFAAIGIGCFIYLPALGNHLQQLWQRLTLPTPSKFTPPR